jgi:hypothetical protein
MLSSQVVLVHGQDFMAILHVVSSAVQGREQGVHGENMHFSHLELIEL